MARTALIYPFWMLKPLLVQVDCDNKYLGCPATGSAFAGILFGTSL